MAQIEITVRRDNGTAIAANATVEDALVADIAMTLTALLFDSAVVPSAEPQPTPPPAQMHSTPQELTPPPPAPGQRRV